MKQNKKRKRISLLNEGAGVLRQTYRDYAAANQIGLTDLMLFYQLLFAESVPTQKELCVLLSVSKTTLNSMIRRWTDRKYIVLIARTDNKREKEVVLTEEGRYYAEDLIQPLMDAEEKAVGSMNDNELKAAHKAYTRYAKKLRKIILPDPLPDHQ